MKIVSCDNFGRDYHADHLIAEGITNEAAGKIMVKALQDTCFAEGSTWYKMVADDYVLEPGMEAVTMEGDDDGEI